MTPLLRWGWYIPATVLSLYALILCLVTIPAVQKEGIFVHRLNVPPFATFHTPQRYGLAPWKTRNLYLNTTDGESLGAWHVLPRSVYAPYADDLPTEPLDQSVFDRAFASRPTIIYFHGNAANRAAYHRVRGYSAMSNMLDVNVVAVDYRGFGDSTGTPSEAGLLVDARAAWDYVHAAMVERGVPDPSTQIILAGQSLGTGVVSALAGHLASKGTYPRAIVLIAPFSSIAELLVEYRLFWVIPLLSPLKAIPWLQRLFISTITTKFNSTASLTNTQSPTLILHALDDGVIPHSHSKVLLHHLHAIHTTNSAVLHQPNLTETTYPSWGSICAFDRGGEHGGKVVRWEGLAGGHNNLGWAEGTMDLIKQIAKL
ncbi:Alpha/Beta hydrolase protein [Papiliotrema laurentii]|uniref:Alpha/Beta hydrolase protein n=1 Tax=Papiliotrema laurentii TaxID=5418 RepID=A0AAD9FQI7_PAPLA|nr:Alpha/Beta hydrolase protein [Papiliotrema laurentii]